MRVLFINNRKLFHTVLECRQFRVVGDIRRGLTSSLAGGCLLSLSPHCLRIRTLKVISFPFFLFFFCSFFTASDSERLYTISLDFSKRNLASWMAVFISLLGSIFFLSLPILYPSTSHPSIYPSILWAFLQLIQVLLPLARFHLWELTLLVPHRTRSPLLPGV